MKNGNFEHIVSKMVPFYLFLALLIQSSFIYADKIEDIDEHDYTSREILKKAPEAAQIEPFDELKEIHQDWFDMFLMPTNGLYHSPSASMMAQVAQSEKPLEEQLEDIKTLANQITLAIQSEMANLLAYALSEQEKETEEHDENNLRKKRSVETPMDSSQLVMRLLKHIKSNNEYQNIAIEKMMSAQEIADKYGIEFNPDPEILSDLAIAANEQAKEMTAILNDALDLANVTKAENVSFVPLEETHQTAENSTIDARNESDTYYMYSLHTPEEMVEHHNTPPHHEHHPDIIPQNQHNYELHETYYFHPESQILPPPVHQHYNPVTPMPNPFEPNTFFPTQDHYSQHSFMEPITTTTTIVLPFEEHFEPEPELIGEEYEETVTSRVFIDHESPDASTVNHVMTYTISEKSHFRTPQIEQLPQQMQYYFFLI